MLSMPKSALDGIQEAADEIERELGVRSRCYPKWTSEGKLSRTEARDRMDRLQAAYNLLLAVGKAMQHLPFVWMALAALITTMLLASGCMSVPTVLHELAADTNTVHVLVSTPYGTVTVDRNQETP